jgi:hypothetical protein
MPRRSGWLARRAALVAGVAWLAVIMVVAVIVAWPSGPRHVTFDGRDYVAGGCSITPNRRALKVLQAFPTTQGEVPLYQPAPVVTPDTVYLFRAGRCVGSYGLEGGT